MSLILTVSIESLNIQIKSVFKHKYEVYVRGFFKEQNITNKKIMNFLFLRILNGPKEFANLYIYDVRKITINYEFTVFTTYFNRKYKKKQIVQKISQPSESTTYGSVQE